MSFITELLENQGANSNKSQAIINEQINFAKKYVLTASRNRQTDCIFTPFCNDLNTYNISLPEVIYAIAKELNDNGLIVIPQGIRLYISWKKELLEAKQRELAAFAKNNEVKLNDSIAINQELISVKKGKKNAEKMITTLKLKEDYGIDEIPIGNIFE